ncbi:MAG: adenylate/guanylate cyclase domain-containing protein [Alphaproteobacteria bacterium]|nr:adenylate/guanylate cyclase domain-containing protein [Alphaproteobacteria bacterium]
MAVGLARRWRSWWRTGRLTGVVLLIALVALRMADPGLIETLRLKTFDMYQRWTPLERPEKPVVIVDIDEVSLKTLGQWPWPRHYIAKLVGDLTNAGAAAIGFDMFFAEPDPHSGGNFVDRAFGLTPELRQQIQRLPSTDELFANILKQSKIVVLGQGADVGTSPAEALIPPRVTPVAEFNGDPRPFLLGFGYLIRNIPVLEEAASGIGMFVLRPDRDDTIRRVPAVVRIGKNLYPTLVLEMLRVASGEPQYAIRSVPNVENAGIASVAVKGFEIPTDRRGRLWVRFSRHDPSIYLPAKDILTGKFDPQAIKGKFVLVGTSALGLKDLRTTPVETVIPGVEIHAQLLKSILLKEHLTRLNGIDAIELAIIILTGLLLIAVLPSGSAVSMVAVFASLVAALVCSSWFLLARQAFLVDASFPVISCTALFVVLTFLKFMREAAQRREIRAAFAHYLAPEQVNRLAEDPSLLHTGGETREMSFLFSDVRGFTAIAEEYKSDPQALTRLINRLLTPMTERIQARRGTIDKYMGDCVMAFWNAPLDDKDHALHACEAARDMLRALDALNAERLAEMDGDTARFKPLRVGVGINTGDCVVGNMGSDQRFDYTVLGDAVNLAARLESQSRAYGVDIVIGEATAEAVAGRFALLQLDLIAVKGKSEAVQVFTILGDADMVNAPAFQRWHAAHDALLAAYRARQWDTAEARLGECRGLARETLGDRAPIGLYDVYAERIADFRRVPPEQDWDGVYRAVNK